MVKKILTFGILLVVLTGLLVPHVAFGQNAAGLSTVGKQVSINPVAGSNGGFFDPFFKLIGQFLIGVSSLFLILSGKLFDFVVKFTIIDMSKNFSEYGIDKSITAAWATLRDIANLCFIFVLLFAAFKTMFDTNFGGYSKTIMNIVIVALLINFSLFFSKVVIDASNVVSLGFYKSIASANSMSLTNTEGNFGFSGISGGYMRMLGLQTFFGSGALDNVKGGALAILTFGILSSIFLLITAVILLIAGIMFATRFIILVFLMVLSPLALIAFIIPGMNKHFGEWKESLISQSFFAPLYFAMTWVVFKIGSSLVATIPKKAEFSTITTNPNDGALALILNFVLIIGFSIAALIFAKNIATKGAAGTAFKTVAGGIGTVALGGAGLAGRNIIGRGSKLLSESSGLRDVASSNKWYSGAARAGLWTANKGAKSSFDVRGVAETKLGKYVGAGDMMGIAGKFSGKGGYKQAEDDMVKRKLQYAKDVYGQTDSEKDEAKKLEDRFNADKLAEENRIRAERTTEVARRIAAAANGTDEEKRAAEQFKKDVDYRNKNKIFKDDEYTDAFKAGIKAEYEKYAKAGERRQEEYAKRLEKSANIVSAAGAVVGAITGGMAGGIPGATIGVGIGSGIGSKNKAAARKIRFESKGPSKEKKLADAYKAIADTETTTPSDQTTPATPTPPAPNPTP